MAVKGISCVIGKLGTTSATAVITSLSNADATLTINGTSTVVTMTAQAGGDRGSNDPNGDQHAFYFKDEAIEGLTPFTKYDWIVTQGVNSDTGSFTTAPSVKNSKFSLAFTTCFRPNGTFEDELCAWDFLKYYIDNTPEYPTLACLHSDDIYYVDGSSISVVLENSQGRRLTTDGSAARKEYDFACLYGEWFGILDTFYKQGDSSLNRQGAAHSAAFQYCMSKMAFMPQWGDHEFENNLGWTSGNALTDVPNPYHETLNGYDGKALNVYNDLMLPLQGTMLRDTGADSNANHWYADFGCLRYITLDPITRAVSATPQMYGKDQLDDVLGLIGSDSWFHWIDSALAWRGTPTYDGNYGGYTYKTVLDAPAEFKYLWLNDGQTPPALMDNKYSNGVLGSCVWSRGDWHAPVWYYWNKPAGSGLVGESIHEIGLSTVNNSGSGSQFLTGATADSDFAADNVEVLGSISKAGEFTVGKQHNLRMTIAEVDGTLSTPQMVITQWDIEQDADGTYDESDNFTYTRKTVTDDAGNIWRKVGVRKIALLSGSNDGYDSGESAFQIAGVNVT